MKEFQNHFSDTNSVLSVVKGSLSNDDSCKTHSTTNHFTSDDFLFIVNLPFLPSNVNQTENDLLDIGQWVYGFKTAQSAESAQQSWDPAAVWKTLSDVDKYLKPCPPSHAWISA